MTQSPAMAATLDGYQLRLPSFEGPLDVLLRLIERDQLAISEISLLAVFDQFMAHLDAMEAHAPDAIAEFLMVAGRLSVLKSRALLPRPARAQEEPEEVDLVRQLEAYRAVKAAAELLAVRQRSGSGAFGRGEAVSGPPIEPIRFPPQPPSALVEAVGRWLTRVPAKPALLPRHRAVSLREMISRISAALNHEASISFSRIRATCISPQDTAVAFLAILTLMRRQTVIASQNELFGPIELARGLFVPHSSDEPMDRDLDGTDGDSRHRT
ncbi:MAG: chromosome segregation and condensation protein ScpA [Thermomicrobiales bacterium]|jgi:segregation and condensation protein A|nr:chromosome segregation and condensation protein ScpA [Thermomicrobiales bacterium]